MAQRKKRGIINTEPVLTKLSEGRSGAIQVCVNAKIGSDEYKAAGNVVDSIDRLAKSLTGELDYFWTKPHG